MEEVRRGSCTRLAECVPPRFLKTLVTSVVFPAWLLGHDPSKQILCVSYGQDFSDSLARKSRTLMTSPFYEALFDTRLAKGREAVSDFETTAGGNRFSTSVGGVLTGRGADIIIIDDPLKADDALSEARRRAVNEWFDNTCAVASTARKRGRLSSSCSACMPTILLLTFSNMSRGMCCRSQPSRNRTRLRLLNALRPQANPSKGWRNPATLSAIADRLESIRRE
jgi:Uncharacterized protein conserved in bacteria